MKIATLAIVLRGNKVLLGHKKKGEIGTGTLNGPGGKCEDDESLIDCVVRETREEIGIKLDRDRLKEIAVITFYAAGVPDFVVHVFRTHVFSGMPVETADMTPGWYDIINLPVERMLESDQEWFPKAIRGEKFRANVYYKRRATGFEKIEFFPY
ncbi:MAG: 8-oxo-dGTP diphosphatase [Parcubacteria group bacterium]|nr:8-oxo-dGTP diphosphatase [Parcubacteria group bacterium]